MWIFRLLQVAFLRKPEVFLGFLVFFQPVSKKNSVRELSVTKRHKAGSALSSLIKPHGFVAPVILLHFYTPKTQDKWLITKKYIASS